jgi:hypothetical protein
MGALIDVLVRRRPPGPGVAGPAGPINAPFNAAHDRGGRTSPGAPVPQRGVTNHRARQGAKVAAQHDRRVPSGTQFPYHDVQPVERTTLRHVGLHGGLDHIRPHRYDFS